MAEIIIDGIRINAPEGKNVLECALDAGIYIPHLCHHPDLPPHGSCRMCIVEVEVEGSDQVTTSCTLKPEDNMVIRTKSSRLSKLRSLSLELLLAGHPEDCSTCPKYGNCELQTLIQYMGGAGNRMRHRVKGFKSWEENPLLVHDMNRCVLCGRCVRACNDLRGVGVLSYQKDGLETYVGTIHNKLLKDTDCRFCQACAEVCPTGTIRDKLNAEGRTKEEKAVPCRAACPAHTDVPRYIRYVKEGKMDEAAAVIREKVPFPKTLGYVCSHVCELDCKRGEMNEAMAIREIKRHAAEADTGSLWRGKGKQLKDSGKKVCVVGAGPAGMTAAYYLRKQGHQVTIKEALPAVGGMLRFGIPEYRLPRTIIEEEYRVIEEAGVHTELNIRVEKPLDLRQEYDAVLMAVGAHQGCLLPLEGNDLKGVLLNTDFLRNASLHRETGMGNRVIVLGGGNVAFDCARTAKKLGAEEVHLACLEAREAMTADEEEIKEALEEGIVIHPAQSFEKITGDSQVTGVEFMNVSSFTFDKNRNPVIEKEVGSSHQIEADTVILAVGQKPELTKECGLKLVRGSFIAADQTTMETETDGIFAAGDAVYGTKSVIQAIASGRDAAKQIDRYLGGDGDISEVLAPIEPAPSWIGKKEGFACETRTKEAVCEAGRCLQCDLRLNITAPRLWGDYESEVQ